MIKITDNMIFITCGEACRILRIDGGKLESVCFGKRVEPEDDVVSLIGAFDAELSPEVDLVTVSGEKKNLVAELTVADVKTVNKSDDGCILPTLRGDKTVKVTLATSGGELNAEVYYTPYIRGGIARRVVLSNTGEKTLEVKRICSGGLDIPLGFCVKHGGAVEKDGAIRLSGETDIVVSDSADERRGACYGLYHIYGGGCAAAISGNRINVGMDFVPFGTGKRDGSVSGSYMLRPGEKFMTPELLAVYSENGEGGLMRAVHDILRENLLAEREGHAPISLIYDAKGKLDADALCAAAEAASKLGVDTFVVPVDGNADDKKTLGAVKKTAQTCAELGIRCGVDFVPKKGERGVYRDVKTLYEAGARHFVLRSDRVRDNACTAENYDEAVAFYGALSRSAREFPDATAAICGQADLAALSGAPCFETENTGLAEACAYRYKTNSVVPPCAFCGSVELGSASLKTAFDLCSLGALSYRAAPEKVGEGIGRALRAQIFSYQDDRDLVVGGDLYRLSCVGGGFCAAAVSKDKSKAYVVYINNNSSNKRIRFYGVDEHNLYHVRELDKTFSGAALVGYGIDVSDVPEGESVSFHLRQVADYEM